MKNVNINPLLENDAVYSKNAVELSEKYKCDWDDGVHDSYGIYVREIEQNAQAFHSVRCKVETLVREMEALDIETLSKRAEILCREADAV